MKKFILSVSFATLIILLFCTEPVFKKKNTRPNIIIILADDLGYSDIGCYGGEAHTPNLDQLAQEGVRFSHFYNTSRSCPTRAALLTGLYNHKAGIGEMTFDRNQPGYKGRLSKNSVTLAEVLKSAGYNTGMVGKWHVSNTSEKPDQLDWLSHHVSYPEFSPIDQYPTSRGFNKFFGTIWGVVDYFDPFSLVNGTAPVEKVPDHYYHTDALNDSAASYIKQFSKDEKPFFLYLAHNAPHWPLHALPEDIEKYEDIYKKGWDEIRKARYKRMTDLGIIDPEKCQFTESWGNDLTWDNNPHKEFDARAMAVHAAMIDRMDQGIGRVINALRETGELDNTLIFFLSDNGASPENCARYTPGFDRPGETRDGRPISYAIDKSVLPGPQTTYFSIGARWANVANTPYRFAKADSYEGGVRTPLIAFWPKGIKIKKGSIIPHVGHVMDFMATAIDLSGAVYPDEYQGNQIDPVQGLSLAPALQGKNEPNHPFLYNEHFGARYIRNEKWKMVSRSDGRWHLYDITQDESEVNDMADSHPDLVEKLDKMWNDWAKQNDVFPKP